MNEKRQLLIVGGDFHTSETHTFSVSQNKINALVYANSQSAAILPGGKGRQTEA